MELSALVDDVRRRVPAGDALGRLDAALTLSTELEADADAVVHHFVQEARSAGHSWTAIGQRLGVSKQAARQRFVESRSRPDGVPEPPRSTPRLVRCLEAARQEAAGAGAAEVSTEHLLLGLFCEGVAAETLARLGVQVDDARARARQRFPQGDPVPSTALLDAAAGMARGAGLDYVGTEHVLLALVLDPGSRARRVLLDLGADIAAIKRDLACYVAPARVPRRRRRRAKRAGQGSCSFCGKAAGDGIELVAGPGVRICDECVGLAKEVLAQR